MNSPELKQWLRDNSSGVYRPAAEAADLIDSIEKEIAQLRVNPPAAYVQQVMDYIIDQTKWSNHFPDQCHERIRFVCESVKAGVSLPFKE